MELVATELNPVPSQPVITPVTTADGIVLRAVRWRATARRTRGTVLLVQGRAEFIEKYFETVADLRRRGFAVVAFDWRGQGGSQRDLANPRKGHVDDFSLYERDLAAILDQVILPRCPPPYFVLAHSMGGTILLHALRGKKTPFARLVAAAPMIDIAMVPWPRAARLLSEMLDACGFGASYVPGGGATSISTKPFAGNRLTSDPVRYARNADVAARAPELAIGDPTVAWLDAAYRAMGAFADPNFALEIRTPVLVVAAGADPVVSTPATERFAARLKTGRAIVIPGARHEILMERDGIRDQFWAAFDAFVPGSEGALPDQAESSLSAAS